MSTACWQARRLPIPAAWPVRSSPAVHQWAIISAGLAPILLTGAYLIAGILQPTSYSPMRKTISVMAGQAGTDRWIMTGGIFLVGGCYLVTAAGLTGVRAPARALLIVAGLAGIGIAASPVPASGATPRHLAWTTLGAITTAAWPAFTAPRTSPRPLILSSYGSTAVTAAFAALLGWLLIETRDGSARTRHLLRKPGTTGAGNARCQVREICQLELRSRAGLSAAGCTDACSAGCGRDRGRAAEGPGRAIPLMPG
jgi:Protein of unknown function (DUF998)